MTDADAGFDRRTVLKGLGIGGVSLAGGAGALALGSGSARAQAALDVSLDDATYSGDQGLVNWVGVTATKTLRWSNYDVPVRAFDITHEITLRNATIDGSTDWQTIYEGQTDRLKNWSAKGDSNGWGGDGEYVARHSGDKGEYLNGAAVMDISWAVISDGSHPSEYDSVQSAVDWTDELSVSEDGVTKTRTVRWRTTITFLTDDGEGGLQPVADSDGQAEVTGTTTFDVTVENQPATIDGGTDGSATVK